MCNKIEICTTDEMEEGYNNKEDGIHGDAIDGCNR